MILQMDDSSCIIPLYIRAAFWRLFVVNINPHSGLPTAADSDWSDRHIRMLVVRESASHCCKVLLCECQMLQSESVAVGGMKICTHHNKLWNKAALVMIHPTAYSHLSKILSLWPLCSQRPSVLMIAASKCSLHPLAGLFLSTYVPYFTCRLHYKMIALGGCNNAALFQCAFSPVCI